MKKFGFHTNDIHPDEHEVFEYDTKALDIGLLKIKRVVARCQDWHDANICCKALNAAAAVEGD